MHVITHHCIKIKAVSINIGPFHLRTIDFKRALNYSSISNQNCSNFSKIIHLIILTLVRKYIGRRNKSNVDWERYKYYTLLE